jgi:hypothetical protein
MFSYLNEQYLRKWSQNLTTTQDLNVFLLKLRLNIIPYEYINSRDSIELQFIS